MGGQEKIILPEKYYLDYFRYLLDFLKENYVEVLDEADHAFINSFEGLSEDAQCLFLRFSNRRGEFFRLSKLDYPEITSISKAIDELSKKRFIALDFEPDPSVVNLFTKKEILEVVNEPKPLRPLHKHELVIACYEQYNLYDQVIQSDRVVQVVRQDEFEYLKMLFFGHYRAEMTEFVIRDVGNIKLENLDDEKFSPWFKSGEEAKALFLVSKIRREVRRNLEVFEASELYPFVDSMDWDSILGFSQSKKIGDKLLLEMAQELEREKEPNKALTLYQKTIKHPSRERQIRILHQLERLDEADAIAQEVLRNPVNAKERIFAKDFLNRPKVRINRSTSERVKQGMEITIAVHEGYRVEQACLVHFQEQGFEGVHTENFLWRTLFGLFFWEELFNQDHDSFHHPLQRMTDDVFDEAFYLKREATLESKLKKFKDKKKFYKKVEQTYTEKQGIANPMVFWADEVLLLINSLINYVSVKQLGQVLLMMARNLKDNTTGFPDLFIWRDDEYHFYEIKSPNDHLSSQQLFWLDYFDELKINADVVRVNFITETQDT